MGIESVRTKAKESLEKDINKGYQRRNRGAR